MNIIGIIGITMIMGMSSHSLHAQTLPDKKKTKVNQKDNKGQKQGTWVINIPEKRGEEAYTEFGDYKNSLKNGPWYKLNSVGDIVSVENYKKDLLDGEVKYYVKGNVTVIGAYRGLNPEVKFDTIVVTEPVTGEEKLVAVEADRGSVRHGTWRYFDELTGYMSKLEEYQIDSLIYEEYFQYTKADSTFYQERNKNLPHMKKAAPKPAKKQHSYLN